MNSDAFQSDSSDALPPDRRVDRICDHFEAAWKRTERPQIENYLANCPAAWAPALLSELLPIELTYRHRRGETPSRREYLARFADHAEAIGQAFEEIGQQQTELTSRHRPRGSSREAVDRPAKQPRNRSSCHGIDYPVRMW